MPDDFSAGKSDIICYYYTIICFILATSFSLDFVFPNDFSEGKSDIICYYYTIICFILATSFSLDFVFPNDFSEGKSDNIIMLLLYNNLFHY